MPILMLGNDLTIRSFTPLAERFFNLIPSDIGRRISDINPNIIVSNFDKMVVDVVDSLRIQEHDVQDREAAVFLAHRPYRTTENRLKGGGLARDIDELKARLEEITSLIRQPLLTLHGDFRVSKANKRFIENLKRRAKHRRQCLIRNRQWRVANSGVKALLEGLLPRKNAWRISRSTTTFRGSVRATSS